MQEQNPPFFPDSAPPDFPPPIPFETLHSTGSGRAYRLKFYGDANIFWYLDRQYLTDDCYFEPLCAVGKSSSFALFLW